MKKNKHAGSTFESFLEEANIYKDVHNAAIKNIITGYLQKHIIFIKSFFLKTFYKK